MIGISSAIQRVYAFIEKAAKSRDPAWIYGETGVGKTTCAQLIHYYSSVSEKPFVIITPENELDNILKLNEHSTIFFKNFFDFSKESQKEIIKLIEDKSFANNNVRIIVSADKNLIFQNTMSVEIPPLRERKGDITDIAQYYLDIYCDKYDVIPKEFSAAALKMIEKYDWPNNISQMQEIIENAVQTNANHIIKAKALDLKTARKSVANKYNGLQNVSLPLWKIEQRVIEQAISLCEGNIAKAADMLGISSSTIYRKMQNWVK